MPFNGSGTYSLPSGSVVADGTSADAADLNTPLADIESSLSEVTLRDGSTPFEGDQSMGNNRLTNLAAPTARLDAARTVDVMTTAVAYAATVGGTANAIELVFSPTFAALTTGMMVRWKSAGANTSTVTLKIDSETTKDLKKLDNVALAAGDTGPSGHVCLAVYDGTRFLLVNPHTSALTSQANTFNATQTIRSTDAGAGVGPQLILHRDSASPADDDVLGALDFDGEDDGSNQTNYARIAATAVDVTDGTEDARLVFRTQTAGTLTTVASMQKGLYLPGATGDDKGQGTVNATTYYALGVPLPNVVIKSANEDVTGTTTLQNDDELFFAMAASTRYAFKFYIHYSSPAAADFKFDLASSAVSPPVAVSVAVTYVTPDNTAGADMHEALNESVSITHTSVQTYGYIEISGYVQNDSDAGNLRFRFSQATSNGGTTTVRRGSILEYRVV